MNNSLRSDESESEKKIAQEWFRELRDQFCKKFEGIDGEKFTRKTWKHSGEGGGEMSTLKGNVFEKVGVNISTVKGEFKEDFRKQISGTEEAPNYWASGISVVAHMQSPFVPAFHFNTRFIQTGKKWFGGGADMTPSIFINDDVNFFHRSIENVCNKHDKNYYPDFKKQCDEYFYLPHRDEPRGEGGIFFDHLNNNNFDNDFNFIHDFGEDILTTICTIIEKRKNKSWSQDEKDIQLYKRGRYVEFNLLWDRGTLFGLKTGGSTEAILMSMPPTAKWK
ncbi:MAG: oxygen-dependent coproporphyrinogen oxidase [Alphaproteobacteria bacterium]